MCYMGSSPKFCWKPRDLFWRTSSTEFCKALTDTTDPVPKLYGAFFKNLLHFLNLSKFDLLPFEATRHIICKMALLENKRAF